MSEIESESWYAELHERAGGNGESDFETLNLELAMQNEDLRRANREARECRDHYKSLFDHAPIACVVVDDRSAIIEPNSSATMLFDLPADELRGRELTGFLSADDANLFWLAKRRVDASSQTSRCEVTVIGPNNPVPARLVISSIPSGGSSQVLLLPLPDAAVAADRRVLLVDDDDKIREALSRLLTHSGLNVVVASNGREAVEKLRQLHPFVDGIISDVEMPEMTGVELAEYTLQFGLPPVILISGGPKPRIPGLLFLAKPPSLQELRAALDDLCSD